MNDVTRILSDIERGDLKAACELLPLVYDELRKLAAQRLVREKSGQTLQATALVHEVYLRLVGSDGSDSRRWNGRGHFFAAAAEAMRRILVENARRRDRLKRGGGLTRNPLLDVHTALDTPADEVLAIDDSLTRLSEEDPDAAEVVKLRYFAGMSVDEAAQSLGISRATAYRHWAYARAWILCDIAVEK